MNHPLISIVTIVFNNVQSIEKTVKSVIEQSYPNFEYIVIDGASTDGTVALLNKYSDQIHQLVSEPDKGLYDAMNKGVDRCNGDYVIFMNSGDWFYNNNVLKEIFTSADMREYDFIYGATELRTESGSRIYKSGNASNFWKKLVIHQSLFTKREICLSNKFDLSYKVSADFDFIYKLFFFRHKFKQLDVVVSSFDMVGYSHHHRYIGFKEDRKIALKYEGRRLLSYRVYLHYVKISALGRTVDFLKGYLPTVYTPLKKLWNRNT